MKALPLTLGFIALIVLATLVFDRFVSHPVGRYVPVHSEAQLIRMDTVTGTVSIWRGGELIQQVDPKTARMVDVRSPAGWVELGK